MEEAAENGKELLHSAHANEWMNEWIHIYIYIYIYKPSPPPPFLKLQSFAVIIVMIAGNSLST